MSIHVPIDYPNALPACTTRAELCAQIEALIARLDQMDGDADFEEDNEDCCAARDDTGGKHPNDGYGDGLPGDPLDAEDCDQDFCLAGDDGIFAGSASPPPYDAVRVGAGDEIDEEYDCLDARCLRDARERIAAKRVKVAQDRGNVMRALWRTSIRMAGCSETDSAWQKPRGAGRFLRECEALQRKNVTPISRKTAQMRGENASR